MRAAGLGLIVLALYAAPAIAQQKSSSRVDLGDELNKWLLGDDKGASKPASSEGGGLTGLINGLFSGTDDRPVRGETPRVEGLARAIDANTLDVTKTDRTVVRVRQWGIDAPDTGQWPWGPRARGELDRLLAAADGRVSCTSDGTTTRSGLLVARCFAGEVDLSAKLIEGGYGVEWREVSGGAYTQLESSARTAERGVWERR